MVKKPRKKIKKPPTVPSLDEVLQDLKNVRLVADDAPTITTSNFTINNIAALMQLGFNTETVQNRYDNPFWNEFMQKLKDLERLKIIENEIANIHARLALEKQETQEKTEQLRRDIEKKKAILAKIKK